jgi:N-methylhydantoinase A/oxoprolinase/acetone carboxylase beta subunit
MAYLLGVDTGGTYTDAVVLDEATDSVLASAKALTTRPDLAQGAQGYAGEYDDPEVAAQMAKDEKDGKDTENL